MFGSSRPPKQPDYKPPFTPSQASPSVVTAGLTPNRESSNPSLSSRFLSLIGSSGGLGRKPSQSGRTLIGGS